jgi:phospholipid/cholesterol/gamma-HCH transport system substrate-binding protein
VVARVASLGALALALVLVVVILFGGGDSYSVRAYFQDAGGLVSGDQVIIGPATIGSITDVSLSDNGQAQISIKLDPSAAPLRQGTTAHVYENSLSGVANHYVALVPGPKSAAPIPSGGAISSDHTTSFVGLDQVFDAFDPLTRLGLRGLIRGEAASIKGRALPANRTLLYLAPGLSSTSDVTRQLALNEPAFDGLLVQGAQALQALASRSRQLTELVANTNATTAAIAGQSQALQRALALLPGALTHTTSTFAGLRSTLDALDPVVAASKPASRQLAQFSAALRVFTDASIPTLGHLSVLISNPSGSGDLTSLFSEAPALGRQGRLSPPDPGHEQLAEAGRLPALLHARRGRVTREPGSGRCLLRRQRPLHPHAAVLQRVRPGRIERAQLEAGLCALPGPPDRPRPLSRRRGPAGA